jgi:leucyl-tRNA---protein transferase
MPSQAVLRPHVTPHELDQFLAQGWRHFGTYFFRYSSLPDGLQIQPLRMCLADFTPNRSQRRSWQRNQDLITRVERALITPEYRRLFALHKTRFLHNIPDALEDFLGHHPERQPCDTRVIRVEHQQQLLAAHFIDLAEHSLSSVYSIYNPAWSERGLGIFTILKAIEYAKSLGKTWYYPGYATREPSHYDYKKSFAALEFFDWREWKPLEAKAKASTTSLWDVLKTAPRFAEIIIEPDSSPAPEIDL